MEIGSLPVPHGAPANRNDYTDMEVRRGTFTFLETYLNTTIY